MRQAHVLVDRDFAIGATDPRLFGAFVEHEVAANAALAQTAGLKAQ